MWKIIVVLTAAIFLECFATDELLVETSNGKVQGTTFNSPSGRNFYTWRHIPFAKPPVGELRFEPPVRPEPWTDILDGSEDSPACLFAFPTSEGNPVPTNGHSEDCLYVNVYSPQPANTSLKLPVMFWVYGGGFVIGSGDFAFTDPTPLLEEDVIVVTFNYRLDAFGFLSTEDNVVPGNNGLKDQWAALIWTKENIAFFGGDPLDITMFGESAGALSVGFHLISPMSRNLFQGGIMESGTALLNSMQVNSRANAVQLAARANSSITEASSSEDIVAVLREADAQLIANLSWAIHGSNFLFSPTLEVEEGNPTPFLSRPLYEEMAAGNITKVPIIIGANSEEELVFVQTEEALQELAKAYDANLDLLLPVMNLRENVSSDTVTRLIKNFYLGSGSFQDNPGTLIRLLTDSTFLRPAIKHAILQSQFSNVFFYEFSFVGTLSADNLEIPGCGRVAHADEVGYLFNISTSPILTEADFLTRKRFVKLWTNFAKTKNPTPNDDSSELLQNVTWEPFDTDRYQYLDIDGNLTLKYYWQTEASAFWDFIWTAYSFHPYNTY